MALLRICNASQVVMVCAKGEKMLQGASMQNVVVLEAPDSGGLSVVVDSMGRIAAVGGDKEVWLCAIRDKCIMQIHNTLTDTAHVLTFYLLSTLICAHFNN